ncbi:hypothetical protein VZQ01_02035 [Myxococcus faecalis]|jgi:hypothetical protein|uniref:hypothetical protein n=1 Tax=Myxococcus TaxID=32 RepID=UPI001CBFB0B8|nr:MULTISPECIES: hypothetical protein [unclassified Myxococcus]MBZ4402389.1 hypothetical protein [Myxococcus sp. AS-1-15]MBZ4412455.1 hypothetical protein [Myxococcus sp. XM-1-1-1]BDT33802.1 hypothetical protein MFMH1_34710 [Myxococcus sp. MH1]
MELYRSAQSKAKSNQPQHFYYSRTKLIIGTVIWVVATAFFGYLAFAARDKGAAVLAIAGLILFGCLVMLVNCIKPMVLGKMDQPGLTIGHDGIHFADGVHIAWEHIEENTYLDQSYMGIPIGKFVVIKTTLKKPKGKQYRVAALDMSSDEYLATCDRYSQR